MSGQHEVSALSPVLQPHTSAVALPGQMTRRQLNLGLLGSLVALAAPRGLPAVVWLAKPLLDFAIAGGWYHGLRRVGGQLVVGEQLSLLPEPDNPYDANAIAVHRLDGLKLGYIPRHANRPIVDLLRQAARIEAVVVGPIKTGDDKRKGEDFAFTGYSVGNPRIRLNLMTATAQA